MDIFPCLLYKFLGKLKSFVRNKVWLEGSIAECYIGDEVLYFCLRYFDDIEMSFNWPPCVDNCPEPELEPSSRELLIPRVGKPVGGSETFKLTAIEKL